MDAKMVESLKLNAKELVESGEMKTTEDVVKHFTSAEIAAMFDYLVEVLKIELK
jgi:hypothetical protein